ncbi:MAG: type I restriction endonuclease subunit R [Candidatus Omnitrophota bacterium]|nr:type I restriction endonuclease subunit R [Candidatus Omnitrophota bacterium]
MTGGYSEQALVKAAAIELFEKLGYSHQDCYEEKFGEGSTLGRQTTMEVVLLPRLKSALKCLNPELSSAIIEQAIEEITKDRSTLSVGVANKEIYNILTKGAKVSIRREDGTEDKEVVKVIDFDNPENNDFFLASEFWISGEMYKRRADLVAFVNGIPLIFIELKAVHRKLENAFRDNLTDYKDTIPQVFWYNALIILSNGSQSRIGSITADWEHFNEWKKITSEGEKGVVSLDTIIKGICQKERFLDILENFILFQKIGKAESALIKILAKNHQYLGVNNVVEAFRDIKKKQGKLGVFWHTQGSGKSFSMIFFSQKILRKFYGDYTFLIVTDRRELDKQIYDNFASTGAVTEAEVHAESGEHLRQLLRENHRNIFTLIHKFRTDTGEPYPVLTDRSDIIVIADEAHRTQYDQLAMNMRKALPNATFIAFTATPLIEGEERTKETFGDYVSIYSFKQSVADEATVALYYENRIPEVQLDEKVLSEGLERIVEETVLDEKQEEKLEREFAREYHIITRDDRLEKIAEDIVAHFIERGYQGKAMVVAIDKPTAVKMHDKVRKYWKKYIEKLEKELSTTNDEEKGKEIYDTIKYMEETDMAVVVSCEQNEVARFRNLGLDIATHRRRMNTEDLATKFKDEEDHFRVVFVCAMWMTGFDVPCLSTIYLDKPMKNHTLMQTIARANRVFGEKPNGLIVDYIGIFRNLQKALAIYNPGGLEIDYPVRPKSELLKELEEALSKATQLCNKAGVDIVKISQADKLQKIKLLDDAVDNLLADDKVKREYLTVSNVVSKLYKAILPDPKAEAYKERYYIFKTIAGKIRSLYPEVDITDIRDKMEKLLDESLTAEGYIIEEPPRKVDLSKIDFDALKKRFVQNRKHIEAEKLKNALKQKLTEMVRLNKARVGFLEKFQKLVEEYNSGAINVDVFFDRLKTFAKELSEEDKRKISEGLTEEELAMFDLLYKPDLTDKERDKVKIVAKKLLETLKKEKLVLDWRKRQQTRAAVLLAIQNILDEGLPESYTRPLYEDCCIRVYQHIYDSYFGVDKSIYQMVNHN